MIFLTKKCRNYAACGVSQTPIYNGNNEVDVEPIICQPTDVVFDDEHEFMWCNHRICLAGFRGHSADSLIVFIDDKMMFSGDTILPIPTVTRFPPGSTKAFWEEDMPRLGKQDGSMTVYPGHGSVGRLDEMLAVNKMPKRYMGR